MKKFPILMLFVFCLCSLLGGVILSPIKLAAADEAAGATYYISSASKSLESSSSGSYTIGLVEYVQLFYNDTTASINHQKDTIILQNNIDMSGQQLQATIGNLEKPFMGQFDGNGYTISNLSVDTSVEASDASERSEQVTGLFGYAKNANISNVGLGGIITLKSGGCLSCYVGSLVGLAENCSLQYVQIVASKIDFQNNFDNNVNFGGIVGLAQDCQKMENLICRVTNLGSWEFSRNDKKIHAFGGIVGRLNNSPITFAIVETKFAASLSDTFLGEVYTGGVAGIVCEGGSKIINVAIENTYNLKDETGLNCLRSGEVAGAVRNPIPVCNPLTRQYNLSYVHYKNNNIRPFGDAGDYAYDNANIDENDGLSLTALKADANGGYSYFSLLKWHPLMEDWNFNSVWYVPQNQICLQSFIESFSIRVSNSNTGIITGEVLTNSIKYGKEARLHFEFAENMVDFYTPTTLNLSGVEVAKIYATNEDGKVSYIISGNDDFEIEGVENGFDIIIKNVNKAVEGAYSVTTRAVTFSGKVDSKLFEENGQENTEVKPGYVYYVGDNNVEINPSTGPLVMNLLSYNQHYRIGTKSVPDLPYAFVGWVMLKDGKTMDLGNGVLDFTFGVTENFDGDFEIYAKYTVNACNITCKMDGGVVKIVFGESNVVEASEQVVSVAKGGDLKIRIYIDNGYTFDKALFLEELDIFKSLNPEETEKIEDGYKCFQFIFDLDKINPDYLNSLTINARTSKETNENNSWIWWAIGGGVGAVVLVGFIILIVVLIKRRGGGFGGMGGAGKISKKSYKNMYY